MDHSNYAKNAKDKENIYKNICKVYNKKEKDILLALGNEELKKILRVDIFKIDKAMNDGEQIVKTKLNNYRNGTNQDNEDLDDINLDDIKNEAYEYACSWTLWQVDDAVEVYIDIPNDFSLVQYIKKNLYDLIKLSIKKTIAEMEMNWAHEDMDVTEELDNMMTVLAPASTLYSISQAAEKTAEEAAAVARVETAMNSRLVPSYEDSMIWINKMRASAAAAKQEAAARRAAEAAAVARVEMAMNSRLAPSYEDSMKWIEKTKADLYPYLNPSNSLNTGGRKKIYKTRKARKIKKKSYKKNKKYKYNKRKQTIKKTKL